MSRPCRAARRLPSVLERLEPRLLMAFSADANFQPAGVPVPAGYVADVGAAFGACPPCGLSSARGPDRIAGRASWNA